MPDKATPSSLCFICCERGVTRKWVLQAIANYADNDNSTTLAWGINNQGICQGHISMELFCPVNEENLVKLDFELASAQQITFRLRGLPPFVTGRWQLLHGSGQIVSQNFTMSNQDSKFSANISGYTILALLVHIATPQAGAGRDVVDLPCGRQQRIALVEGMKLNQNLLDVKFLVGDETVGAHKLVLVAQSEVFDRLFQADMQEAESNRVQIEDATADEFRAFLDVVYTGSCETTNQHLAALLRLADKYMMGKVRDILVQHALYQLSPENAAETLMALDAYGSNTEAVGLVVKFIVQHIHCVELEQLGKEQLLKICRERHA